MPFVRKRDACVCIKSFFCYCKKQYWHWHISFYLFSSSFSLQSLKNYLCFWARVIFIARRPGTYYSRFFPMCVPCRQLSRMEKKKNSFMLDNELKYMAKWLLGHFLSHLNVHAWLNEGIVRVFCQLLFIIPLPPLVILSSSSKAIEWETCANKREKRVLKDAFELEGGVAKTNNQLWHHDSYMPEHSFASSCVRWALIDNWIIDNFPWTVM